MIKSLILRSLLFCRAIDAENRIHFSASRAGGSLQDPLRSSAARGPFSCFAERRMSVAGDLRRLASS